MPEMLPEANMTLEIQDRFKYHQNVCVYSYTMAFWTWKDWEKHIDWMALNGINIPLAFTGQEEIWRRAYNQVNGFILTFFQLFYKRLFKVCCPETPEILKVG
jgi:alpha-N-acetylglucosaminidase